MILKSAYFVLLKHLYLIDINQAKGISSNPVDQDQTDSFLNFNDLQLNRAGNKMISMDLKVGSKLGPN